MARLLFRLWLLLIMPSMAVSGQITHIDDFASQYDAPRSIRIWTPDNYPAHAPYRVIYMHDGQMLFDARKTWNGQEWRADETAQKLHDAGDLPGFIIVGIDARANAARYGEYFPQDAAALLEAPYGAAALRANHYLRFVVEELTPYIEANYAVRKDKAGRFMVGSSMGGLISLYALARYPDIFGGVAAMSTHWPGGPVTNWQKLDAGGKATAKALQDYFIANLPAPGQHRLYFDYGSATLDRLYPPLQRAFDRRLVVAGFKTDDFTSRFFEGAAHDETAWAARLGGVLRYLLDPQKPIKSSAQQ